ncbi:MAG: DUF2721 domain-containing protein [Candidatus Aminicenantales bacterium]|jgi:hypothetical protein
MPIPSLTELIPILQSAIGPVILISGVGLLLLSMTNRFGRVVDRARILAGSIATAEDAQRRALRAQLAVMERRAEVIRRAIMLAAVSVLMAALLIITIFIAALFRLNLGAPAALIFIVCLGALIAGLVEFLRDLNMSLHALKMEIEGGER